MNSDIEVRKLRKDEEHIIQLHNEEIGIILNEGQAEQMCRKIALLLGLSIVDQRENIRLLTQKANDKSCKKYPLGGDDKEEHS
ncbi:hypothetical protein [Arcobacter aquimarinus]|uniref:Uncharacterized protein n=1 Tax=Arcobacter aquimarinus TaxID=1315211 RepID=A0AAE7E1J7_9BACT|nr:hypothetical protein [Arcobacter aquimarinus]QKE26199.1 hypothetical protein AAQM_1452 [Arcobacter aquimarinus]RXI35802.1 hypothetical protein CP986_05320 [Arcobacter aquimarinus]